MFFCHPMGGGVKLMCMIGAGGAARDTKRKLIKPLWRSHANGYIRIFLGFYRDLCFFSEYWGFSVSAGFFYRLVGFLSGRWCFQVNAGNFWVSPGVLGWVLVFSSECWGFDWIMGFLSECWGFHHTDCCWIKDFDAVKIQTIQLNLKQWTQLS